jgi:hypothetical protein
MLVLVPHELIGIRNATGKNPVGIRRVFSFLLNFLQRKGFGGVGGGKFLGRRLHARRF